MSIRITHLYGDLLNLYGSEGNIRALVRRLQDAGETVEVRDVSLDSSEDISGSSLIYLGPGTEKRTVLALNDLRSRSAQLLECMAYGGTVLCSGSSSYLFGETVKDLSGTVHEGLGFCSFNTVFDEKRRYSEYIMKTLVSQFPVVGVINTSATLDWKDDPFFSVEYATDPIIGDTEGVLTASLMLTELQGPLLWRNPGLLDYVAGKAAGHELGYDDADWYRSAVEGYDSVLSVLTKKSGKET